MELGSKWLPVLKKYLTSLKNQGFPIDALPIIAPSKPRESLRNSKSQESALLYSRF
jgi:hypothetical protein